MLLTISVLATGADVLAYHTLVSHQLPLAPLESAAAQRDSGWVVDRVQAWQPTAAERRFDEIGWARSIVEAERLAHKHGRPVFLFVYSVSVANARCGGGPSTLRAGPLSNRQVIDLLNRYFLPVHLSIEEYHGAEFPQPGLTARLRR